ncbi:hypothetical protein LTR17_009981 [Elasticomyces elasticus]|nr:hypothetical protein LTR17_009981 [Elasticomyces elasticus]
MSGNNESRYPGKRGYGGNLGPGRFGGPGPSVINASNAGMYHELYMMGYGGHRPIFPAGLEPPPAMLTDRRGRRGGRTRRQMGGQGGFGMPGQGAGFPGGMGGGGGFPNQMGGGMPGMGGGMQGVGGR